MTNTASLDRYALLAVDPDLRDHQDDFGKSSPNASRSVTINDPGGRIGRRVGERKCLLARETAKTAICQLEAKKNSRMIDRMELHLTRV